MLGSLRSYETLRKPESPDCRETDIEYYSSTLFDRRRMISSWLEACDGDHGYHCKSTFRHRGTSDVPSWLIDVSAGCVKQANSEHKYLALSYVWEDSNARESCGMLRKENLELMKKPRAFETVDGIPLAVRDAMELTAVLGLQYLWVDRFCIVQDDESSKDHQIRNMASVYANAYLTIIAAAGDASSPLQGKLNQNPRKRPQFRSHIDLLNDSKWITRAWTLQELLFSRRAVFFLEGRIAWECHCDVWEQVEMRQYVETFNNNILCTNRFTGASTGLQQTQWPDMNEYSHIVEDYSGCSLTNEEDTVPAFLGVTNVLSESFIGGFIYGMPALFFDIALLWRPEERIQRKMTGNQGTVLPSWSWMGWRFGVAKVDLVLWRAASSYILSSERRKRGIKQKMLQSSNSTSVQPTIKWFLGLPHRQRKIENVGLQYQDAQSDPNADLPRGWKGSYKPGRTCFEHESDKLTLFNYPVPVRDDTIRDTNYRSFGPLLHFETTHGHFNIKFYCRKNAHKSPDNDIAIANIFDNNEVWAGHFRSHDMKLGLNSENYDGQEKLEFIAISTGSERDRSDVFDKEYFMLHMDADKKVEFVNVLWIERINGIAHRKGLGHIVKSTWERQGPEKVDVVLG